MKTTMMKCNQSLEDKFIKGKSYKAVVNHKNTVGIVDENGYKTFFGKTERYMTRKEDLEKLPGTGLEDAIEYSICDYFNYNERIKETAERIW